jgi:transcriptional regulator with GAF, ATPase, and Fis domain
LDLEVPPDSPAARLLDAGDASGAAGAETGDAALDELPVQHAVETATSLLASGVQDVTQAMVEGVPLNDVLRMVLESIYRALGMQRVVLCLKDRSGDVLSGRLGLGHEASQVARVFRVPLQSPDELFSAVCLKGVDTLIRDASAANVASRLPAWYRKEVHAPAFLLLPMQFKGAPFGLIYADRTTTDATGLQEQELALLRTLRNQAVMAFRQARA